MDSQSLGLWGGIAGGIIGVLGGFMGTYFSIKNTNGPRERAFMVRAAVLCWLAISAFLLGFWLIPVPYRFLLWIPYPFLLTWGIRTSNRKQAEICQQEMAGGN